MKAAGAVYLQNSTCILPDSESHRARFAEASTMVKDSGGESVTLLATSSGESEDEALVAKFNAERDAEYKEFIQECGAFLAEIEKETARSNFTFSELEENESNLERLETWLHRIRSRDFFKAPGEEAAAEAFSRCQKVFETFSMKVYSSEGDNKC